LKVSIKINKVLSVFVKRSTMVAFEPFHRSNDFKQSMLSRKRHVNCNDKL